jgi:hypothetical protein
MGKNKKIILIVICCFSIGLCNAQQVFQTDFMVERVKKAIHTLNDSDANYKDADEISLAYSIVAFDYCFIKDHEEAFAEVGGREKQWDLIEKYKDKYRKNYLTSLKMNIHCFSKEEYLEIKAYLSKTLRLDTPISYDLISLYQLNQFKDTLYAIANDNWFTELEEELYQSRLPKAVRLGSLPHITLANLGDKKREERILNLLVDHVAAFDKDKLKKADAVRLHNFYDEVLSITLSKLLSKESMEKTLLMIDYHFLLNDYFDESYDAIYLPLSKQYADDVIGSKLHPSCRDYFDYNNSALFSHQRDKRIMHQRAENIKKAITEDDLSLFNPPTTQEYLFLSIRVLPPRFEYKWSNIYQLWESEKE